VVAEVAPDTNLAKMENLITITRVQTALSTAVVDNPKVAMAPAAVEVAPDLMAV
jgi:hypothetical protein